jgi:hypothetical protein
VRNQFPEKNALIVHSNHTANFIGSVTQSIDLLAPTPVHVSYTWYVFDSGTFTLQGDGGDNNVLLAGTFQQTADQTWVFASVIPPRKSPTDLEYDIKLLANMCSDPWSLKSRK